MRCWRGEPRVRVREERVRGPGVADGARDEHGHDEAVDGDNTGHDDRDERLHHNVRAERAQTGDRYTALGGPDRGTER